MDKRLENQRKFKSWANLSNGGRVYRLFVAGRRGWSAQYVKEVTVDEETVRFVQEIYDDQTRAFWLKFTKNTPLIPATKN